MLSRFIILLLFCGVLSVPAADQPNIVVILADDMGYGELSCLNPDKGKIKTPALDAIAKSGMIFTDAHSGSSVCTPTRYGLLTGRYAWRTRLQSGVLTGGKSLIAKERMTVADMLKAKGYHTAIIGKWHLGMLFDGETNSGKVPVGTKVSDGPIDAGGFDEFHGFHHARQMSLWIDDEEVTKNITPVEMLPMLTESAVKYIHGRKGKGPFFLYVPWNSPHSPVTPSKDWQGKSGLNAHADFVMETDHGYGQVVKALKDTGVLDNTLVICSADNGTSHSTSKMNDLKKMGHFSSAHLRGSKADIWDGGHRVPFIAHWPGVIKPGTRTDALVCLTDIMATAAEVAGAEIPDNAAEDSVSFLPALKGGKGSRSSVIHHSISGYFAIRQDNYKLAVCPNSGGWTAPKPSAGEWAKLKDAGKPLVQLYDMDKDLSEQNNLAAAMPEKVQAIRALLEKHVANGRSTPGAKQANDAAITIDKKPGAGGGKKKKDKKKKKK
jgi:arylsulfatase A-like enzyme